MYIRPATFDDARDIFDWRNDSLTRAMSGSGQVITWEDHCHWLERSLANDSRLLLICEEVETGNRKVAIVFFDVTRDRATVSVNLAPKMRGRGFAPRCLEAAIAALQGAFPKVRRLEARIKAINHASQRSFKRAGFLHSGTEGEMLIYEYVPEREHG